MADFELIRQMAARQHGLVSRAQTREAGFAREALQRRVRDGYLTWVTPRVLRIGGAATSPWQSAMAGVLDIGFGAVASHLTAAALWGVPHVPAEPVDVSVVRYVRRNQSPVRLHHLTAIPDDQVAVLHDVPVTAPPFTVLLVAGKFGARRAAQVFDHLLGAGETTVSETDAVIEGLARQGRNGIKIVRKLIKARSDGQPPAESNNERRAEYLARRAGVTTLRRQVNVGYPQWIGRVDFDDTELPFIVEVHSQRFHMSWANRKADAERIEKLRAAGYTVVVVWDYEIWNEPEVVMDRIARGRAQAAGRTAAGFS